MKNVLVMICVLFCLCLFCGCDEVGAQDSVSDPKKENEPISAPNPTPERFGLTEKELAAIEDIIRKPYSGGPYTLDDVAEITCLGYDKMYVDGEWVEYKHLVEYEVVFKNGEISKIAINTILLDD